MTSQLIYYHESYKSRWSLENFVETRHITTLGRSKGVVIPSYYLKALSLDKGNEVELKLDIENEQIILTNRNPRNRNE